MWNAFFPQSSSNMRKVLQGHSMSIIGYPIEVLDYYRLFISAKETLQHSMRLRFRRPTWTSIDQRLHPPFISLSFFQIVRNLRLGQHISRLSFATVHLSRGIHISSPWELQPQSTSISQLSGSTSERPIFPAFIRINFCFYLWFNVHKVYLKNLRMTLMFWRIPKFFVCYLWLRVALIQVMLAS